MVIRSETHSIANMKKLLTILLLLSTALCYGQAGTQFLGEQVMVDTFCITVNAQHELTVDSGNFATHRWVDSVVAAMGGGAGDLQTVLGNGNTSGGNDIIMETADSLQIDDATANTIASFSGNKKVQSLSASDNRSLLGLGTAATQNTTAFFQVANNLSEGVSATIRTNIGLGNVENTALSTWAGSTNLTTVGTITTGTWNGTAIANANLANSTISGIALGSNLANLTATNTTLTFSGTYNGSTARTIGINLSNANTWLADISVPDEVYDATAWNGSVEVPTKNALRDKIESLSGGSPGGSDTYVQFNDASSFGGESDFTWTKATNTLQIGNALGTSGYAKVNLQGDSAYLIWNGGMGSIQVIGSDMQHRNSSVYSFDADVTVPVLAYNATTWNGSTSVPTRDDVRDKIETMTTTINTKIATVKTTIYITGSAATHNFTANMLYCEVWVTGQGGGGGGSRASDGSSQACGSGGGAGGTAYILYNATEAGASATYTVGTAAGAGGSNVGGNGTAGTNSTFDPAGTGATLTGTGGALGTGLDNATPAISFRLGGLGGVPTNGSLNITGGDGGTASISSTAGTTIPIVSGYGGASMWGGGGQAVAVVTGTTTAGVAGRAYGSGGSGAVSLNSSAGSVGGNGAVGVIKIVEYIQ